MAIMLYKWCFTPFFSMLLFMGGKPAVQINENKAHPLHIATVEIEHNGTDKTLEITCKTFWDDFESILSKNNKKTIDLTSTKAVSDNNKVIFEYLKSHLQITIDGKIIPLNFVGYEKEDVVVFSYLQADNVASVKKVSIISSIMHDMFDDQTEIVHVIVNGNRKSTKLDYPVKNAEFSF
ncbi:MAG: hypothetical protein E6H07_17825 [Bacteroidetes bacterium]|nr:MAG: hypothetical protein E6H07_17825 [Bacteroidota bacterium]